MRLKQAIFSIIVLVFLAVAPTNAQVFGNRVKYQIHEVQPKETAYGISEKYEITVEELYKHNPDAKQRLSIGDRLLIPEKKKSWFGSKELPVAAQDTNVMMYVIKSKETLYSISKKFDIPISKLIRMNPELKEGPKVGQQIRVPKIQLLDDQVIGIFEGKDSLNLQLDTIPRITKRLRPKYRIGIMLPLFLEENDTVQVYNDSPFDKIYRNSKIGIDVIMGVEHALDSLKQLGFNVDVYTFDTKNSPERAIQLARTPFMKSMDLIIGPLFGKNIGPVAAMLYRDSVQVINLFSKNTDLIEQFHNVWQVQASEKEEVEALVSYINQNTNRKNVIVYRQDDPFQAELMDIFKKGIKPFDSLQTPFVKEIVADSGTLALVDSAQFLLDDENVVLSLSNDKVFITDLISKLNVLRFDNIHLFGFSDIYELNNPDYAYLMKLHTIVSTPYYIDVHNENVLAFYEKYRAKNFEEPSKYALLAYDASFNALYHIMKYGTVMSNYRQETTYGLATKFKYTPSEKGKINSQLYLLQYKDYEIKPLNWNPFPEVVKPIENSPKDSNRPMPVKDTNELDRLKGISFD